ncbi:tRNA (adenosine(37)-N6)-threonylcarbamoyltransferase complex ATPase subunit type 1 TsaE [Brevundimonas sp.]|uniref:tRNA (adenosine(37)-N6)-threonylcarbamoyltransferase complex ATPase subunit type 1 TsaE n=1 Tax=Brevundimonas sp. TaxID=1871086 RepID=UPI002D1FA2A2|nr:tRNA (adenosine(37)-N6)-threonylcarbamoyltransferase complex ATPase subunit type 1 TsaE [Brevundimonas sp.]
MILDGTVEVRLADADATARLGAAISRQVEPGEAILLSGPLGAGKSVLARGLIQALAGPEEEVPSPTFTLVQFYETDPAIAHFDLYRLEGQGEALEIGLEEALDQGAAIVEWPVRISQREWARLAPDQLALELSHAGEGRIARLTPQGRWKGRRLEF